MSREPLYVLLIEDSQDDAELLLTELRRGGFEPIYERVETAGELRTALDQGAWDLVLSDYRMPRFDGLEALSILKEHGLDAPFILVSGAIGEALAVSAMKAGAHDYVMKDRLARLAPAVRRELEESEIRKKRREAEEELRRAHQDLERRIEQRTAELSQVNAHLREELDERKRLQEERNRIFVHLLRAQKLQGIGQLAVNVAHEINNPVSWILSNLNTTQGYYESLTRLMHATWATVERNAARSTGEEIRKEVERLRTEAEADFLLGDGKVALEDSKKGAERIRDIVRSLRVMAHPDPTEHQPGNLEEILENAIRICGTELRFKADVKRTYTGLPPVPCHAGQIEQVFVNLLLNAAQAIDGKGLIETSTALDAGDAVIRIRDNGKGIPPENMERLFEPFFTTKPAGRGTGLGLHIAFRIVRRPEEPRSGTIRSAPRRLLRRPDFLQDFPSKSALSFVAGSPVR